MEQDIPAELTQSMWADVLKQVGGDKEKAKGLFKGMEEQENEKAKERKVRELEANFPDTPKELIVKVLAENNWDVELAILPLFERVEQQRQAEKEHERQEQAKKREAERKARKQQASEQAQSFLQNLFANIPGEKIQALLDQNEGDVDATTEQLLALVKDEEENQAKARKKEKEAEVLKQQAELERNLKIDALKQRFEEFISEEEIVERLQKAKWDINEASAELLKITECRKVEKLRALYALMSQEQVIAALDAAKWDMREAMRLLQAESKKPVVKELEPKALEKEKPHKIEHEKEPEAFRDRSFLERSAILGKELNELIRAQQAEADPDLIFKRELEKKLRIGPEDVPGLPGMVPLTKKMIDNLRAAKPVDEEGEKGTHEVAKPAPLDKESFIAGEKGFKLLLAASPAHLDVGQKITVQWETEGDTTTYDWIGMYKADAPADQYITWNWIGKAQKQGSVSFAPSEFGQYVFRYFSRSKTNLLATSNVVAVGPQFKMEASSAAEGTKKMLIKFQQQTGKVYPSAWIGLYEKSQQDNRQYFTYEWVASAIDNAIAFEAPKVGNWEFRYFPQRTYVDVARCSLLLEGQDELVLTLVGKEMRITLNLQTVDPQVDSVWVGIYRTEEMDNRQYRKYKYVTINSGEVSFVSPSTPGSYEARLFANKSLQLVCSSNTVQV